MSDKEKLSGLDQFSALVRHSSKSSRGGDAAPIGRCVRNDVVTDALIERVEAMDRAGERLVGLGADLPGEAAIARVERNRAARLRFAATEADRAERLKGEPVEHRPRGEIGPTAATRARLKPDVLRRLFHNGHLDQFQLLAAGMIRDVFEAVVKDMLPRAARIGLGVARRTAFVPSIERLPAKLARQYVHVYRPWAVRFGAPTWRLDGREAALLMSPLAIVIEVVVDNRTVDEVVAGLGVPRACGRAVVLDVLAVALEAYAELAAVVVEAEEAGRIETLDAAARVWA